MKGSATLVAFLALACPVALAFTGGSLLVAPKACSTSSSSSSSTSSNLCMSSSPIGDNQLDRRSLLSIFPAAATAAAVLATSSFPSPAFAADGKPKIVVLGGAGWVGSHVDKLLLEQGCQVVSVSRSSPAAQADKIKANLGAPLSAGIEYVTLDASTDDISTVLNGASAVISCVGALPGSSNQRAGNGAVNVRIADAARAAGIGTFVYISVASDVANSPAKFIIGEYFKGKAEAEAAIKKGYDGTSSLIIKPAFIAGGPPGEIRPPGPPGMAPVPVEAVAKAAVAGALGSLKGTVDGNSAIIQAAAA